MENQPTISTVPVQLRDAVQVPPAHIAPPPPPRTSNTRLLIIAGVLIAGILLFGFLYIRSTAQEAPEPEATVTPTEAPTPTPPPNLSRISSTSAFLRFSEEVASFAAVLNAFTLQDPTLTPPILDSELELSN